MSDLRLTQQSAGLATTEQHPAAEDLVLFAMQLLASDQGETIQRHALHCTACRDELGRIHGDLASFALTADPAKPSSAGRDRLLAQVAREKRIVTTPVIKPEAQPTPKVSAEALTRSLADFGRGKGSTLIPEAPVMAPRRAQVQAWAGWAFAAVFATLAVFLYGDYRSVEENLAAQSGQMQRLNARASESHQLMDALTDPQAKRITLMPKAPPRGPIGGVTYNPRKGALVFLASNLDPVQTYKTYELWIIPADGGAPIAAGAFHPDEHGSASVIMPNLPSGVDAKAFRVTIEDAGGSDKPTPPVIMAGS
jgi:hypothetical protein